MHFVVHWGPVSGNAVPSNIQMQLSQILKPHSWAQPITNFYVVNVPSSGEYQNISNGLVAVAQQFPTQIRLIVSPPMTGGSYNGFLPQTMWPEINSRSI